MEKKYKEGEIINILTFPDIIPLYCEEKEGTKFIGVRQKKKVYVVTKEEAGNTLDEILERRNETQKDKR